MAICVGFPSIARRDARVLILGSLPGVESLRRGEYYAKKQNNFWPIMGALIGADAALPYRQRIAALSRHHIALWDVCASAQRVGSLDSAIEGATVAVNDFNKFFKKHPRLEAICFNGQPALRLFTRLALPTLSPHSAALPRLALPSTSPAHARMRFDDKLSLWRDALSPFIS